MDEALYWLKSNNSYSRKKNKIKSGFFNYTIDGIYYFDCSSFCFTLLNRVFNFSQKYYYKDEIKVWTTKVYLKHIHFHKSIFEIIESINKEGQKLDLNKLQIGDFILGRADLINNGINHIMLHIGEGYIIHSTENLFYDNKQTIMRNGILMAKLNSSSCYTEI